MKKLLLGLLVFSGFAGQLPEAYAQEVSLALTPPNIVIQTEAPAFIEKTINIENRGNETIDLEIALRSFIQEKNESIFEKIAVNDNSQAVSIITLSPKQQKTLTLQITLPKTEKNADYYFSILFISKDIYSNDVAEQPADQATQARINTKTAIATNVLLSIYTGKKEPQGLIKGYTTPFFAEHGPVPFHVRFENTGEFLLIPEGVILIKNMFGQTVGRVNLAKTNVLAQTERDIKVAWNETFLLGPYRADLKLWLSDNTAVYFKRTIWFISFPIQIGAGIMGLIIAALLLWKRIKPHLFF